MSAPDVSVAALIGGGDTSEKLRKVNIGFGQIFVKSREISLNLAPNLLLSRLSQAKGIIESLRRKLTIAENRVTSAAGEAQDQAAAYEDKLGAPLLVVFCFFARFFIAHRRGRGPSPCYSDSVVV